MFFDLEAHSLLCVHDCMTHPLGVLLWDVRVLRYNGIDKYVKGFHVHFAF